MESGHRADVKLANKIAYSIPIETLTGEVLQKRMRYANHLVDAALLPPPPPPPPPPVYSDKIFQRNVTSYRHKWQQHPVKSSVDRNGGSSRRASQRDIKHRVPSTRYPTPIISTDEKKGGEVIEKMATEGASNEAANRFRTLGLDPNYMANMLEGNKQ
jgi:hypothetical protein